MSPAVNGWANVCRAYGALLRDGINRPLVTGNPAIDNRQLTTDNRQLTTGN